MKIEILPVLLIAFILGKAFGAMDWSWWWVLSPIWIPLGIVVIIKLIVWILR